MARVPPDLPAFLCQVFGSTPRLARHGAIEVAIGVDYPDAGMTTFVTIGCAKAPVTLWRGRDVGFELVLTTSVSVPELAKTLASAAREHLACRRSGRRRSPVEFNGVYAPGYPPHLFFGDELSQAPALSGRRRIGKGTTKFLAAIAITDAELREYDRSVPELIARIQASGATDDYTSR